MKWRATEAEEQAADVELLVTSPVLAYPDFQQLFIVHTGASGAGLGAVVEQVGEDGQLHPIAYASQTLSKHERNYLYGVTDLEALGVIWALHSFRAYLLGHQCTVYTDHASLHAPLQAQHSGGRLAQWRETVAEYDLEIKYRSGQCNRNTDILSRSPLSRSADSLSGDNHRNAKL